MWMDMLLTLLQWEAILSILIALSIFASWLLADWCFDKVGTAQLKRLDASELDPPAAAELQWRMWANRWETWGEQIGPFVLRIAIGVFCTTAVIFSFLCIFYPPHWP